MNPGLLDLVDGCPALRSLPLAASTMSFVTLDDAGVPWLAGQKPAAWIESVPATVSEIRYPSMI